MPSKKSTKTVDLVSHFIQKSAYYHELDDSASNAISNDAPPALRQNFITKGKDSIAITTLGKALKELKWK